MGKPRRYKFGPLKRTPERKKFFAFDTETRPGPDGRGSDFVLGVVFDGEQFNVFRNRFKMIRYMMGKVHSGYTAWASNVEYDLQVLFPETTWPVFYNYFGGLLKGAKALIRDRVRLVNGKNGKVWHNQREWLHFADTLNHWPGGVARYGELLGLEKLEMPDPSKVPGKELETYCARDTEIVYRMVEHCQEIYNDMGCELKGTLASSAKDLFRRRFFEEDHGYWPIPKRELDVYRMAYYGARTEAFRRGIFDNVYMGDVVSMYPYVMRSLDVPVIGTRMPMSKKIRDGYEGLACVDVVVGDEYYPPLPFRYDKLYFPTGKWSGVYPLNELRYAEQHGARITKVHYCVQFEKSAPIFREYVDTLFPMKAEAAAKGDTLWEKTVKLFLNSLYGVFATGYDATLVAPGWYDATDIPGDIPPEMERLSGFQVVKGDPVYPVSTNFIWPMYITAEARIMLHKLLRKFDGLYCDTDSVASFSKIKKSRALGTLDLKYFSKTMEILAPKVYKDDHNVKVKGVPWGAVAAIEIATEDGHGFDMMSMGELVKLADRYYYQKVSRFRESIRRGIRPNTWDWVKKDLTFGNPKRRFFKDGDSWPWDVKKIMERPLTPSLKRTVLPSFKIQYKGPMGDRLRVDGDGTANVA